ncbi:carbamoyl phosphate synthase small subunit [Fodinisporobacter ferrooxydans]|uniref:Carbamoyl phosphate synthase small chain n=1 Tax=Fodinisporobacter ferrooxydans TaxID=2901836 RepID=A0ABY4CP74_9BACL|nr:carbamoyl phosphate synthase small subunit [Alicyclobacillaceae bacterium MYW30-H2]
MKGMLVLENGLTFHGTIIGDKQNGYGEVVFNTGMTGYQEILTDPSYANQIVVMTYPLIGNYGINENDFESHRSWVAGFITSSACDQPSHFQSEMTLDDYLKEQGIVGLANVDTRAVVRAIREQGTMRGYILPALETMDVSDLKFPELSKSVVKHVTCKTAYQASVRGSHHVVLIDLGAKQNIVQSLIHKGCRVTVAPPSIGLKEISELRPDGIMLSNGPGNPEDCAEWLPLIRELAEAYPIFGICLGHQLLALAFGAKTEKLRFGHRGSNHPVKELATGKVWITSQNHGFTVVEQSLPACLQVTHRNVNDASVEGLKHSRLPVFSVQYHPEACPGPQDSEYLFDQFLRLMAERRGQSLAYAT